MSENIVLQNEEENVIIATFNIIETNTTIALKNPTSMTQIDWGDGTVNSELRHIYIDAGEYTCTIYGVTSICDMAFSSCDSLTSVAIPDGVTSIDDRAFSNCSSLTSITVGQNNENYQDIDGNLYSKDGKTLIQYAIGKTATSFTIPDSVTTIGYEAFYYCKSLTSVVIGNSVTSIGPYAFSHCSSLTSVVFGDSVTSIGDSAFSSCDSLTSVDIGDSVTSIGNYAFYYCSSLTSVVIPDSVTSIGIWAFKDCSSLTSVYFKNQNPISIDMLNKSQLNATTPVYYVPANFIEIYRSTWSDMVAAEQIQPDLPGKRLITLNNLQLYHDTLKEKYLDSMATQNWVMQYIADNFATLMEEYLNSAEATENKPTAADIGTIFEEEEA